MRTPIAVIALVGLGAWTGVGCDSGALPDVSSRPPAGASLEQKLEALGYGTWEATSEPDKRNVTYFDPARSYEGLTLHVTGHPPEARLVDMEGNLVHVWHAPHGPARWKTVQLAPTGALLVVNRNRSVAALDRDSNVLWEYRTHAHHDLDVSSNGDVIALAWDVANVDRSGHTLELVDDRILVLREGRRIREVSIHGLFADRVSRKGWRKLEKVNASDKAVKPISAFDLYHTNSIDVIERDLPGLCRKGDVLISIRELDLIAIVDLEEPRVLWSFGAGQLDGQHHATLQDDDTILLFDNGRARKRSRIVRVDPRTDRIVWEYSGDPGDDFFELNQGSVQLLPNGNLMITRSSQGVVRERTPGGDLVWEFYQPVVENGADGPQREKLFRAVRYSPEFVRTALGPMHTLYTVRAE